MAYTNQDALDHLREARALPCRRCFLFRDRHKVVFGKGLAEADLMVVGSAPYERDDRRGQPFAGYEGEMLEGLLKKAGLSADDLYFTNIVKCRPPDREPSLAECGSCSPLIHTQIAIVQPKALLVLGTVAGRFLTSCDEDATMKDLRAGEWHYSNLTTGIRIPAIVTHSPSWFIEHLKTDQAPIIGREIVTDMREAAKYVEGRVV